MTNTVFKKTMSLLLCAVMIFSMLPLNAVAEIVHNEEHHDEHVHSGGTASCTALAVCDGCSESYGELAAHSYDEQGLCVCGAEKPAEEPAEHQHSWLYSAEGSTITASCEDADACGLSASLTLNSGSLEAGAAYAPFDAEELSAFNQLTGLTLSEADVVYYTDLESGTEVSPEAPGEYFASLTVGEACAVAGFSLAAAAAAPIADDLETVLTVHFYKSGETTPYSTLHYSDFIVGWDEALKAPDGDSVELVLHADYGFRDIAEAYSGYGNLYVDDSNLRITIDLNGHTISRTLGFPTDYGQVIYVNNGHLTIKDSSEGKTGKIAGGYTRAVGGDYLHDDTAGGIQLRNSSTLTLLSGSITGNKTIENGGAISLNESATLYIKGGSITGNEAINNKDANVNFGGAGGAIVAADNSNIYMEGGSISNNKSDRDGAAISWRSKGVLSLTGGEITDNRVKVSNYLYKGSRTGAGIFVDGSSGASAPIVGGSIKIAGNTKDGNGIHNDNVSLGSGRMLKYASNKPFVEGAEVWINSYTETEGNKTKDITIADNNSGFAEDSYFFIHSDSDTRYIRAAFDKATGAHSIHYTLKDDSNVFDARIKGIGVAASASGVLVDAAVDNTARTITLTAKANKKATFDSVALGNLADFTFETLGTFIYESNTLRNLNGTEKDRTFKSLAADGTYIPYTVVIVPEGGQWAAEQDSPVILHKMDVTVNGLAYVFNSFEYGWNYGLPVAEEGTPVTMRLQGDWVVGGAFNVYDAWNGNLHLNDSDIKLTVDLNGHTISRGLTEQTAVDHGSVFYVDNGALTITDSVGGGRVTGGATKGDGGGIYYESDKNLTISGNCSITGNFAGGSGGGIYVNDESTIGTVILDGASVAGNSAKANAGGIYFEDGALTINNGGSVSNNFAAGKGGGIYFDSGNALTLNSGTISGNTAHGNGGGAYFENGNLKIFAGGTISGNKGKEGGGVHWASDDSMYHAGTITGNEALSCGGGIYVSKSSADVHFGVKAVVTGNTAPQGADNVYLSDKGNDIKNGLKYSEGYALTDGANIGIRAGYSIDDSDLFSAGESGFDQNAGSYFTSDNSAYSVYLAIEPSDSGHPYKLYLIKTPGTPVMEVTANGITTAYDDFSKGWAAATKASEGTPTTAKLLADWIEDGSFSGDGTSDGRLSIDDGDMDLTLDLNGHTLSRGLTQGLGANEPNNSIRSGQVIRVSDGKFTVIDSSAQQTGVITGGFNKHCGGAFYVSGGELYFMGGTITGNYAQDGAGIGINGGNVYILGGKITGNYAKYAGVNTPNGGAIYTNSNGKLYLEDCEISGNYSTDLGGGVAINGSASDITVTLGGSVKITGNISRGDVVDNLFIYHSGEPGSSTIVQDPKNPLADDAIVSITSYDGFNEKLDECCISGDGNNFAFDDYKHFISDVEGYYIRPVYNEGDSKTPYDLYLTRTNSADALQPGISSVAVINEDVLVGAELDNTTKTITLTAKNTKQNSFKFAELNKLISIVKVNAVKIVGEDQPYDLTSGPVTYKALANNGNYTAYTVEIVPEGGQWAAQQDPAADSGYVMMVTAEASGEMKVFKSFTDGWKEAHDKASGGAPMRVTLLADWIASGGKFTGTGTDDGRLYIDDSDIKLTIDLNGHTISRNLSSTTSSGQVFKIDDGCLTIMDSVGGGKITGAKNNGDGGAFLVEYGTLIINGGEITGNSAKYGGAIYANDYEDVFIHINGGSITRNSASEAGGGIFVYDGFLYVTGGTISGNSAPKGSAIFWDSWDKLVLTGGTITGNAAGSGGGAVFIENEGSVYVGGTAVVKGNTATGGYPNVFLNSTSADLNHAVGQNDDVPTASLKSGAEIWIFGKIGDNDECFSDSESRFNADSINYFRADASGYVMRSMQNTDVKHPYKLYITKETGSDVASSKSTIVYDYNLNGTDASSSSQVIVGSSVTVKGAPQHAALPENVEFLGWLVDGNLYNENDKIVAVPSGIMAVAQWKYSSPEGLAAAEAHGQLESGKITGTDSAMEYSADGGNTWTDVTGTAITGLTPGSYHVRVKENGSYAASNSVSLTIEFSDHDWIDPSCDKPSTCAVCGETTGSALNHQFETDTVRKATCTEGGLNVSTCSVCGHEEEEYILPIGHDFELDKKVAPACGVDGYTDYVCRNDSTHTDRVVDTGTALAHNYVSGVTTAPTCTETGVRTYICSFCGHNYTESVEALEHVEVVIPAVAATCSSTGLTEGKYCSACGVTTVAQRIVQALNHTPSSAATCTEAQICTVCKIVLNAATGHTAGSAATCTEAQTCTVCPTVLVAAKGHTLGENATCTSASKCTVCYVQLEAASGHTEIVDVAVAPTCSATGLSAGSHCGRCGVVIDAQEVLPKVDHKYTNYVSNGNATCTEDGTKTAHCDFGCGTTDTVTDEDTKLQHSFTQYVANGDATCKKGGTKTASCDYRCGTTDTIADTETVGDHSFDNGSVTTAPTCTKDGVITYTCTLCSTTKTGVAPRTGHDYAVEAHAPTCSADGYRVYTCNNDSTHTYTEQDTGTKLQHQNVGEVTTAPTCTEAGVKTFACALCGTVDRTEPVTALGHTEVTDAAVDPTCTKTGLTEGKHCSVCSEVTDEQTVVPATGHTEVTDAAVDPTCTETGLTEGKHCSVCGVVTEEQTVVPATGHADSGWSTDGSQHWKECGNAGCNETISAKQNHVDEDGDSVCDECNGNIVVTPAVPEPTPTPEPNPTPDPAPAPAPESAPSSAPTYVPSSGTDTSKDEPTVSITGDGGSTSVDVTVKDGAATVEDVDKAELEEVIGSEDGSSVVIDLSGIKEDVESVVIDSDIISKIAEAAGESGSLTVDLGKGVSIELGGASLAKIAEAAGGEEIIITISLVTDLSSLTEQQREAIGTRPAYQITIRCGDEFISELGGEVILKVPYILQQGETAEDLLVYFVDADGNCEACETAYDAATKSILWETDHLSVYMVAYEQPAEPVIQPEIGTEPAPEETESGSFANLLIWLIILAVICLAVGVVLVLRRRRDR